MYETFVSYSLRFRKAARCIVHVLQGISNGCYIGNVCRTLEKVAAYQALFSSRISLRLCDNSFTLKGYLTGVDYVLVLFNSIRNSSGNQRVNRSHIWKDQTRNDDLEKTAKYHLEHLKAWYAHCRGRI